MQEIWNPVFGWEMFYEISNLGNVRSLQREGTTNFGLRKYGGKNVKSFIHGNGYLCVNLTKKDTRKQYLVHRLVLESFIGQCPVGMEACHKDGNRLNANLSNLRWDTRSNNALDKRNHLTWQGGENCGTSKLKLEQVKFIKNNKNIPTKILAENFDVSLNTIQRVKANQTWNFVK